MKTLRALIKTMRPRQWIKNGLLMAAVVFDRQLSLHHLEPFIRSLAAMLLFCLLASSVYIFNDLMDVEADRQHPKKRFRPIASGELPVPTARIAAAVLLVITLVCAYLLSPAFSLVCVLYMALNLAYSIWLKHIPIIDVLVLAADFVLRVDAGVSVVKVERFSPWLYVVTTLLALYVGFGKRRAELTLLGDSANSHRKVLTGYTLPLLDQLITIVSSTTIIAYSLYTFSAPNLPDDHFMILTIPFVLYGIFRYLYLIEVKHYGGAPEELLYSDRPLQVTILLWGLSVLLVFYAIKPV
jgi:4-hydroxybenzoate polyprenyltransferase